MTTRPGWLQVKLFSLCGQHGEETLLKKKNEFYPFFSPIVLVATILSYRYNSRTGSGETKVDSHVSSDTQPKQTSFLTQRASNPEASRTNVSEETPCTWQPWLARIARHMSRWCAMRQGYPYRPSPP